MAPKEIIRGTLPEGAPRSKRLAYLLTDSNWLARFFAEIGNGTPPYLAAELTGVPRSTMYAWMDIGGARNPQGVPDDAPDPYRTFVIQLKMAEATMKRPIVANMYEVAKKDAHFGLKYMQAREPEEWMPNRLTSLGTSQGDGEDDDGLQMRLIVQMTKDEYRAYLREQQESSNGHSESDSVYPTQSS